MAVPKSNVLSELGIILELTSAPNTTLSVSASPKVNVPPLRVDNPSTVRVPEISTLESISTSLRNCIFSPESVV